MNETQMDLHLLVVFTAVAESASFSKAARHLKVGKGTVSRSIAQLESQLGVELIHRTTHSVALSTAGAALFERTQQHVAALRRAVSDLPERDEAPSGLLRMTAPLDIGSIVLPPVIAAFSRRYPAVRFDVRLLGGVVDFVKEGYDLAIRVATGPMKNSALIARRLGRNPAGVYASPSYLARRGKPKRLDDEKHTWLYHQAGVRLLKPSLDSVHFLVDDFSLARRLLRESGCIGILPRFVARDDVRAGLLEEVTIPGLRELDAELIMVYPSRGQTPKKVTAFRDFLTETLRSGL
ncbi:MAG: LysR family transcriptional regulator [Vicinamibacterales bacterium]